MWYFQEISLKNEFSGGLGSVDANCCIYNGGATRSCVQLGDPMRSAVTGHDGGEREHGNVHVRRTGSRGGSAGRGTALSVDKGDPARTITQGLS